MAAPPPSSRLASPSEQALRRTPATRSVDNVALIVTPPTGARASPETLRITPTGATEPAPEFALEILGGRVSDTRILRQQARRSCDKEREPKANPKSGALNIARKHEPDEAFSDAPTCHGMHVAAVLAAAHHGLENMHLVKASSSNGYISLQTSPRWTISGDIRLLSENVGAGDTPDGEPRFPRTT